MTFLVFVVASTLFVAYANGANDNFKGVATLFGSGTTDYRKALTWATIATFLGSLSAFFLAEKLVKTFSGKGLVPTVVIEDPIFMVAVILGAGLTVFIATKTGIPISTTHSLTGALVGAGLFAVGNELQFAVLGKKFLLPLMVSPVLAVIITVTIYPIFRKIRELTGVKKSTCICVGEKQIPVEAGMVQNGVLTASQLKELDVIVDEEEACKAKSIEVYDGHLFGVHAQRILDFFHFLSAGAVCFARGLNDTPKIVALAVAAGLFGLHWNITLVALAMIVGGIISAKRVAHTMSLKITRMNHGQGFSANLVTAFLVIVASRMGVPVSTTHVSCGSLFGLGAVTGGARWKTIGGIFSAWVLTLPIAAVIAASAFFLLKILF